MQIFRSDEDNRICAMHLDDKRLNKIITEVAQIASSLELTVQLYG